MTNNINNIRPNDRWFFFPTRKFERKLRFSKLTFTTTRANSDFFINNMQNNIDQAVNGSGKLVQV